MSDELRPEPETFDDGLETNLHHIAQHIFSQPPAPPFSYQLGLDHPVPEGEDAAQYHFEILSYLLIWGARYLYGQDVHPATMTEDQFDRLRAYMISTGYVPLLNSETDEDRARTTIRITFEPFQYHQHRHLVGGRCASA